jgi:hypothetical protein
MGSTGASASAGQLYATLLMQAALTVSATLSTFLMSCHRLWMRK